MTELQQLKLSLIERIEKETSLDVLREVSHQLDVPHSVASVPVGPEMEEALRRAEDDRIAGREFSIEEARAFMEARHPYLRKGQDEG